MQEGPAAVCVGREIGTFPIRTVTLDIGDQRPLGVGAGSMAILAFLPDDEIDAVIARNRTWLARYPNFSPAFLRDEAQATRRRGYSLNRNRILNGMSAIGVPVMGRDGRPIASFSVACITERIDGPRESTLEGLLREEAGLLSAVFDPSSSPRPS